LVFLVNQSSRKSRRANPIKYAPRIIRYPPVRIAIVNPSRTERSPNILSGENLFNVSFYMLANGPGYDALRLTARMA